MASANVPKRKLEELFQCVVCLAVPYGKVFQCPSGHLICEECSNGLNRTNCQCPVCRTPLDPDVSKRTRNLAVEQAIEAANLNVACKNDGCLFSGPREEIGAHGKKCAHRLVECPFTPYCDCSFLVPVRKILDNCNLAKCPTDFGIEFDECSFQTIEQRGDLFILRLERKSPELGRAWVKIIGGAEKASKYKAEVIVEDGPTKITHKGGVIPVDVQLRDIAKHEGDAVLTFACKKSRPIAGLKIDFKVLFNCENCDASFDSEEDMEAHHLSNHVVETRLRVVGKSKQTRRRGFRFLYAQ